MTTWLFANFFATELLQAVSAGVTTLTVTPSAAARLPVVVGGSNMEIRLILWDGVLDPEIVAVTANDQSGSLTVVRAKEGTTAKQWPSGTQVRSAITAEVMNAALAAFFDFNAVLAASFLKLIGGTLTGSLVLNADPTLPLGAATKQYADAIQGNKLPLAGGTMGGAINMNNNRMLSLPTPVSGAEPATKTYVDGAISNLSLASADSFPGSHLTTGSSSAYAVTSNVGFTSLVDGTTIGFRPHVMNAINATLAVNVLPAKPLRSTIGVLLPPGTLLAGMPVSATYNLASDSWLLDNIYQGDLDFIAGDIKHSGINADHGRWLLADGRTVSRTGDTGALFTAVGTIWGVGDSVTTFNILDARGRVIAGRDDMGTVPANRITNAESGLVGTTLGASGGVQSTVLTTAQLPVHNHTSPALTDPGHTHPLSENVYAAGTSAPASGAGGALLKAVTASSNTTGITLAATVGNTGSGTTHTNLQPTTIANIFVRF